VGDAKVGLTVTDSVGGKVVVGLEGRNCDVGDTEIGTLIIGVGSVKTTGRIVIGVGKKEAGISVNIAIDGINVG
jgi:hypothetical protein